MNITTHQANVSASPVCMVARGDLGRRGSIASLLAAGIAASAYSQATSLYLSGGQTGSNSTSIEYSWASLTGVGTTYTADADFAISEGGYLQIDDFAEFIMNASVDVAGDVWVTGGGRFLLNAGTLTADYLYLEGSGSFIRTGGAYDVGGLSLRDGASISYQGDDFVSGSGPVSLWGSSTMTLAKDLAVSLLQIHGGSAVSRTSAAVNVSGLLDVSGASFDIRAGDSIGSVSASYGADVRNSGATSVGSVSVSGEDPAGTRATYTADAALAANSVGVYGGGSFVANDDVEVSYFEVSNGGELRLNAGTLTAGSLYLQGSGSFIRTGGAYDVGGLSLRDGASISYEGDDSVSGSVSLWGSSTMTLAKDLAVSSLQIHGGSAVSRTSAAVNVSGLLDLSGTSFDIRAGDSIGSVSASYGADVRNSGATSVGSVSVSGEDPTGTRATYTADAALAANSVGVSGGGSFVANDDVEASYFEVSNGGELHLNAGTLTAGSLYLQGSGSFIRTGGAYDVGGLSLRDGASISYQGDDFVSGSGPVSLWGSSTMTLAKDLAVSSLQIHGGSAVSRTSAAVNVSGLLDLSGTSFDIRAGDSIGSVSASYGADVRNSGATSVGSVSVSGEDPTGTRATYTADAALAANSVGVSGGGSFVANDDVEASYFEVSNGGELHLNAGTLTAGSLYLQGSGSFIRTGGAYDVGGLSLRDGASISYQGDDFVSGSGPVSLWGSSTMTLAKDLAVSSLQIHGGSAVSRTSAAVNVSGLLDLSGTSFDIRAGDSIGSVSASYGADVRNSGATSVGSVSVSGEDPAGTRATYTADAALAANSVGVSGGGSFVANDDVEASYVDIYNGGELRLNAGTLTADYLYLQRSGSFIRTGGAYDVGGLSLRDGATMTFDSGDAIRWNVHIQGIGSMLTSNSLLDLGGLSLVDGGMLTIAGFTGSWNGFLVGLELYGDQQQMLDSYRTQGLLAFAGASSDVTIFYDSASNTTYVAMVPAPGVMVLGMIVGAFGLRGGPARRRK